MHFLKISTGSLLLIWLFTAGSCAQTPYRPAYVREEIALNGTLDEAAWQQAAEVDDFLQFWPVQGGSPSVRTAFRILYDDNFLYVGIWAFNKHRSDIVATEMERDADLYSDDRVGIVLDTYHDQLNGVGFMTNPLGLRFDVDISQDGQVLQKSWDTFWDVETSLRDSTWTAEFRIPFSSLRFQPSDTLTMGFKVIRSITKYNEFAIYPKGDATVSDFLFRLTMATPIVFSRLPARRPLYFSPYVTTQWSVENRLNPESGAYVKETSFLKRTHMAQNELLDKTLSNIGFNLKYGITKNMTLDLTANPDFSQVEVDDRVINFTRFNVNLPEKREFFLEANDYLNFDIGENRLFNSRNIGIYDGQLVPILSGLRLTGKANGYQVGFLNMQTKSVSESGLAPENYTVFRLRKSIINEASTVGGIVTNKISFGDSLVSNQVAGLDLLYRIDPKWFLDLKGSYATNNLKGNDFFSSGFYNVRLVKKSAKGLFHDVSIGSIGKSYDPQLGFVLFNDIRYLEGENGYAFVFKDPETLANIQLINTTYYRHRISANTKETFMIEPMAVDINFLNGMYFYLTYQYLDDTLSQAWDIREDIRIPVNRYKMHNYFFEYGSNENSTYYILSNVQYGQFYGGKRFTFSAELTNNFSKYIKAGIEYDFNRIAFPDSFYLTERKSRFRSHLLGFKLTLTLSTKTSLKTFLQYDNLSNNLFYNVRFRYNPRQGNDLYLIFNQGINTFRRRLEPHLPLIDRHVAGFKYVHTFDLNYSKKQ